MGRWGSAILLASVILFANVQTRIINHIAKKENMPYEIGQSASIAEKAIIEETNISSTTPESGPTTNATSTTPESGPTTNATPRTLTPTVNSSHIDFNFACSTLGDCEYTYVAPYYNWTWYKAEKKEYDDNTKEFNAINKIIDSNFKESFTVYEDVTEQLKCLNETVMNIMGSLKSIEEHQKKISDALDSMEYDLIQAQAFLDEVQTYVGSCFYQQCYLATSTATSTTTTAIPTTPPHCPKNCSSTYSKPSSSCTMMNGSPYCECLGNLDGNNYCSTSLCGNVEISLDENATHLPFWSPGYNGAANSSKSYENNAFCTWTLTSKNGLNVVQFLSIVNKN